MRQAKYWIFLLPLFFVLVCVGAFAQANSEITGIVTDQTGAVVAGADITVLDPTTGFTRSTVTGPTGLYDIAGLNPSNYNLTVTAKGFEKFVQTGVVVNVSATFRVDAKLTLGAETQTVSVVADALTVQTDSNVVSSLISSEEITEIATENRNFAALASLGLGVSSGLPDNNTPGAFGASWGMSINGLRNSHNIWLIDGGESDDRGGGGGMQIMPSQDAIAEFQVMSSNYPPDYGISSGATMSLSMKSGTKSFHGTGWEENRATAYDADTWFNKNGHTAPTSAMPCGKGTSWACTPAMHFNIYGFNIGGPVFIPHVYNSNKNKTFFFYNEEWRKTSSVASGYNPTINKADRPVSGQNLTYVAPGYSSSTFLVVPNVALTSEYYTDHLAPLGLVPNQCFQGVQKPNKDGTIGGSQCYTDTKYGTVQPQTIPNRLFDSNAITYLNGPVLPVATTSDDHAVSTLPLPFTDRDDIVRIDHNFNDKWAILGHYIGDKQNQTEGQPELGWCWCQYNTLTSILSSPAHSSAIKLSGTITPNLLLEASFNYDGNGADITPSANTFLPTNWTVAPVVPAYAITRKVWPGMDFGGPVGSGEDTATEPYHNAAQDYSPKVDVSYTSGKHQYKFGFSYNRYTKNQMLYGDEQGSYGFYAGLTGDSFMDLLLGLSSGYSQKLVAPIRHYVNETTSGYVNDNWHITPRISLQLGLRYDAMPHAWERQNLMGNFIPENYQSNELPIWDGTSGVIDPASPTLYTYQGIPSYINGTGLAGQNKFPRGVVNNDYNTWQPRIGFSDDLFGNGKTVIRGGFGTFYERLQGNDVFSVATSAPFDPQLSISNPYFSTPGKNWSTGAVIAPTNLIFAGSSYALATTYKAPAVAMFSLGVQREIVPSVVWVVQYVGNLAWHQNITNNINMFPKNIGNVNVADPTKAANVQDARCVAGDGGNNWVNPATGAKDVDKACHDANGFNNLGGSDAFNTYQGYTGITQNQNNTNATYNGFQTGLRIQNRWGLSGEIDYTWSHAISITNDDLQNPSNPWYLKYDKGSTNMDRRQILSINYIYKLPIATKSTGIVKTLVGGWELAGTILDEAGNPATPGNTSIDTVGLNGGYTVRPNQIAKMSYPKKTPSIDGKSGGEWFDTTVFQSPVPAWLGGGNLGFGNSGRDAIVGPGRVNLTTSLYKNFAIWKSVKFELRGESFNTLNHTQFNNLQAGMNCANNASGFGTGTPGTGTCVASGSYGMLTGTQDPRNLEVGGRLVF
jgi:hypothetical protein